MKTQKSWLKLAALYVGVGVVVSIIMVLLFQYNDFFRSLFYDRVTPPGGVVSQLSPEQAAEQVRIVTERTANLSFCVMLFIFLLQVFAFLSAILVFCKLRNSGDSINLKLKKLESADLFLDLPLYFGLFGTVSSFIIMSFNPQVSRLLAYSSTLVGIIFSVILRLALQYPTRQSFLAELDATGK
ncbi:MAG: hypothetical protein IKB16_09320 [Lentisphaeria bacterium]|nr:hypothetical protein [Lentisphaeria bacterium]